MLHTLEIRMNLCVHTHTHTHTHDGVHIVVILSIIMHQLHANRRRDTDTILCRANSYPTALLQFGPSFSGPAFFRASTGNSHERI